VEGLTEIYQLNVQLTVGHYVGWLEVEVRNFILSQVPQTLSNHDAEVYLCVHGYSLFVFNAVDIQIWKLDVV
jgi:hypothetical protein